MQFSVGASPHPHSVPLISCLEYPPCKLHLTPKTLSTTVQTTLPCDAVSILCWYFLMFYSTTDNSVKKQPNRRGKGPLALWRRRLVMGQRHLGAHPPCWAHCGHVVKPPTTLGTSSPKSPIRQAAESLLMHPLATRLLLLQGLPSTAFFPFSPTIFLTLLATTSPLLSPPTSASSSLLGWGVASAPVPPPEACNPLSPYSLVLSLWFILCGVNASTRRPAGPEIPMPCRVSQRRMGHLGDWSEGGRAATAPPCPAHLLPAATAPVIMPKGWACLEAQSSLVQLHSGPPL